MSEPSCTFFDTPMSSLWHDGEDCNNSKPSTKVGFVFSILKLITDRCDPRSLKVILTSVSRTHK